jgi:hypothetical protein
MKSRKWSILIRARQRRTWIEFLMEVVVKPFGIALVLSLVVGTSLPAEAQCRSCAVGRCWIAPGYRV